MLSEPLASSEGSTNLPLVMRDQRLTFRLIRIVQVGQASKSLLFKPGHHPPHLEGDMNVLLDLGRKDFGEIFPHASNYSVTSGSHEDFSGESVEFRQNDLP